MTPEEFAEMDAKGRGIKSAYEYTFPNLPKEVPDIYGRLIRETDSAQVRWLTWQKSVQQASRTSGKVPPEVMDYFQRTKQFVRPPEAEKTAPRFTWSPSKLSDHQTCPKMWLAKHYYKTVPYTETEATRWGTEVHLQAELFMKNEPLTNLPAFVAIEPYVKLLATLPGERLIEHKIALDDNWKPAVWDSGDDCARMILDFGVISPDGKTFKGFDYKTGKQKSDTQQMECYCYALAILFPNIESFDMKYIWIKDKCTTGFKVERKDLLPLAKSVREKVALMRRDWFGENDVMRKNGLCRQYCQVYDCAYCGKSR